VAAQDADNATAADQYALASGGEATAITMPDLPYEPADPKHYRPAIGLIGCGGITTWHLHAYKEASYNVVALCDQHKERAQARRDEYFTAADVYTDASQLLARDDIEVVDITTHPEHRVELIDATIDAGKHILTQKPFVLDLANGRRLVEKARERGVKLAVNQNGRWAPHWSYFRQAVNDRLLGSLQSIDFAVYWDHNWVSGTPFDEIPHLLLYDFAIHWFDILRCFAGDAEPSQVVAMLDYGAGQAAKPPLLGQVLVQYPRFQASIVLRANTPVGHADRTRLIGEKATLDSSGPDLNHQTVSLTTEKGTGTFQPKGSWFPTGFHGTMAELLCAIEADREPTNAAAHNLASLQLCFAAAHSADHGIPAVPAEVEKMPGS
jgi:predicted dehydrogenase